MASKLHSSTSVTLVSAIFAPAGTPPQLVKRIETALRGVTRQPEIREALLKQGAVAVGSSSEELDQLVPTELQQWQAVTREANIKPQ